MLKLTLKCTYIKRNTNRRQTGFAFVNQSNPFVLHNSGNLIDGDMFHKKREL